MKVPRSVALALSPDLRYVLGKVSEARDLTRGALEDEARLSSDQVMALFRAVRRLDDVILALRGPSVERDR